MEPVRLHMQNFGNYVNEELSFEGIRLAAIVGPNGAGKSTIFDAMCWVLYGTASKGDSFEDYARKVDEQMAPEYRVTFDFRLKGEVFRVVRHRSIAKNKSLLELFRLTDDGAWEPKSGKGIDETQESINALLGIDYRTLTSSSMIMQGKADSFTGDLKDSQRKEILGTILGHAWWGRAQEVAKATAKGAKDELRSLTDRATPLKVRAASRGVVEADLSEQMGLLAAAEADLQKASGEVAELEARSRQRDSLEQQIRVLDQQRGARQTARQQTLQDMNGVRMEIGQQEALLGRPATIETHLPEAEKTLADAGTALQVATAEANEADTLVRMASTVQAQVNDLDRQIQARRAEQTQITADIQRARQQLDGYQNVVVREQTIRAAAETATALEVDLADLADQERRYVVLDRQARDMERQSADFERRQQSETAALEAKLAAYQQQSSTLNQVPCAGDLQSKCPLLAGARQAAEQVELLTKQLQASRLMANPYAEDLQRVTTERDGIGFDAETLTGVKAALTEVQADARQMPALETALKMVADLSERRAKLEADFLAKGTEVQEITQKRQGLAAQVGDMVALQYANRLAQSAFANAQGREATARERLAGLRKELEEAQTQAEQATTRIESLKDRVIELNGRINQIDVEIAGLGTQQDALQGQLAAFETLAGQLAEAQRRLTDVRTTEATVREQIGRLRQALTGIEQAELELQQIAQDLADAEHQTAVYEELSKACGQKGGVPALLIEAAVPQIEKLTNEFLSRMAGGRLAVRLDTQADTKGGTQQEVLRIAVTDQGTTRKYSTYSGAERFMVDVALRVALSKFLAHRAGAEISLLVLDEGLGSLDEANQPAVMEALNLATQEFSKVLVITHITALQDILPQRIEVSRVADESKISRVA